MIPYVLFIIFIFLSALFAELSFRQKKLSQILFLYIFILFVGLRYDTGVDYLSYQNIFYEQYEVPEFGYNFLNSNVYKLVHQFWVFTLFIAFIIIFILSKIFRYYNNYYYSFFLYLIMAGGYGFMVNGTRQAIASCFILCSITFIFKRRILFFLFFLFLAFLFHRSSIIFLPFYWICNFPYQHKFCFFSFLFFFISALFYNYGNLFITLFNYTPYYKYVDLLDQFREIEAHSTRLGFLFINIIGVIILYRSKILIKQTPQLIPLLWVYYFFLIFRNLLIELPVFNRITICFDYSMYIIIPYYINSYIKYHNKLILYFIFSIFLSILFFKAVSNETFNLKYKSVLFVKDISE
ncbi:hypothetical protein EZS27_002449 [termite gut metagenome]|uniref:Transmembrane protein EpsG n=1 Tax=termite gut metagenome TaxID=433724 RepID=A0A5J4SXW2_9ZZZZ